MDGLRIWQIAIAIPILVWAFLMIFAPFYWHATSSNTRKTNEKLDTLIKQNEELMEKLQAPKSQPR